LELGYLATFIASLHHVRRWLFPSAYQNDSQTWDAYEDLMQTFTHDCDPPTCFTVWAI